MLFQGEMINFFLKNETQRSESFKEDIIFVKTWLFYLYTRRGLDRAKFIVYNPLLFFLVTGMESIRKSGITGMRSIRKCGMIGLGSIRQSGMTGMGSIRKKWQDWYEINTKKWYDRYDVYKLNCMNKT